MTEDDAVSAASLATRPTTSDTEAREDPTTSETGSPSASRVTSGFIRKVGEPGVQDFTVSAVGLLKAMLMHPFGRHDYIEELDYTIVNGEIVEMGTERFCWLCRAKEMST